MIFFPAKRTEAFWLGARFLAEVSYMSQTNPTLSDRVLLALAQAPRQRRTFEQLVLQLGMEGDQRPVLLGELRRLFNVSEVTRVGMDVWAIPDRGEER